MHCTQHSATEPRNTCGGGMVDYCMLYVIMVHVNVKRRVEMCLSLCCRTERLL